MEAPPGEALAPDVSSPNSRPRRNRPNVSYADIENGEPIIAQPGIDFQETLKKHESKFLPPEEVVSYFESGAHLSKEFFDSQGFNKPIVVQNVNTVEGFRLPDRTSFGVNNVMELVGPKVELDAIDVASQTEVLPKLTLQEWAEYFATPPQQRRRILNVISLEFSDSQLRDIVQSPRFVREVDWIDTVWPRELEEHFPKVQYYCLMSVAGSYTDFHVDFGGSSVWYHILRGAKEFFLIEPTSENLLLFERWLTCERQSFIFFADQVAKCHRLQLNAGQTLLIPTGWIHAVYTPVDSLVFGGNFLLSRNLSTQLSIYEIEVRARVPDKFRFPLYERMNWYVAKRYVDRFEAAVAAAAPKPETVALEPADAPLLPSLNTLASASFDVSRFPVASPTTRPLMPHEVAGLRALHAALAKWLATPAHHDRPPVTIGDPQVLLNRLEGFLSSSALVTVQMQPLASNVPQLKLRLRLPAESAASSGQAHVKPESIPSWLEPENLLPPAAGPAAQPAPTAGDSQLKIKVKVADMAAVLPPPKRARARRRVRDDEEEEFLLSTMPGAADDDDEYAGEGVSDGGVSSDSDRPKKKKEKRLRRSSSNPSKPPARNIIDSPNAPKRKLGERLKGFVVSDEEASGSDYSVGDVDENADYEPTLRHRVSTGATEAFDAPRPAPLSTKVSKSPAKPKVAKDPPKKKTTVRDRLSQKLGIKSGGFKPVFRR